jgi:hypothetical protein
MAIAGEFFGKRPGRCLALRREGTHFLALSRQSANDLVLGIGGTGRTSSHLIHKGFSWKPTLKVHWRAKRFSVSGKPLARSHLKWLPR